MAVAITASVTREASVPVCLAMAAMARCAVAELPKLRRLLASGHVENLRAPRAAGRAAGRLGCDQVGGEQ
jgi:hypothetical protein